MSGIRQAWSKAVLQLLGRRRAWRVGRSLYLCARADYPNTMATNGERLMQRHLLQACAQLGMRPVVIDVGANVGAWSQSLFATYALCPMGQGVDLHCFEPVPATFETLKRRLVGIPQGVSVRFEPKAISRCRGTMEMYIVGEQAGTNSLHPDGTQGAQCISVEVTTADAYCSDNNIPLVHYLKCDTEGHDAEVLAGADRLLQEGRIMTFQFEYNHRWVYSRHYLRDVFELVKRRPYQLGKITPTGIDLYEHWHPELERFFEGNYALIHDSALEWYPVCRGAFDEANTYGA